MERRSAHRIKPPVPSRFLLRAERTSIFTGMYSFYVDSVWVSYIIPALLLLALVYKAVKLARARWDISKVPMSELDWMVVKVILCACLLAFLMRGMASYLSERHLRWEATSLSAELINFAEEEEKRMPSAESKDWDMYTRGVARVAEEARNDYAQRFAARVALLRREFARRGLSDATFDSFYANPKDPLAVRTVGERLSLLAEQLH
jgi:hypothetical protein